LLAQAHQLRNRQHAAGSAACPELLRELQAPVLAALTAQLARLDRELAAVAAADTPIGAQLRRLPALPGPGLVTAAALVARLPAERLATSKHAAAYVGLCPREKASGVSVRGRSTIGSFGPAHLRRALYLPAIVAMHANPTLRAFAERLRAKGKPARVGIVAVMRKLLLLAWTLLRSGRPFAPPAPTCPPVPSPSVSQPAGS
jgi:transposase